MPDDPVSVVSFPVCNTWVTIEENIVIDILHFIVRFEEKK